MMRATNARGDVSSEALDAYKRSDQATRPEHTVNDAVGNPNTGEVHDNRHSEVQVTSVVGPIILCKPRQ